jgi:hypothetical protein
MAAEELKNYTKWLAKWAVVLYFSVVLIGKLPISRDDSDPGEWGKRSGVAVRTDALTGCQYLEAVSGGLTPRIDSAGKQIGCRQ